MGANVVGGSNKLTQYAYENRLQDSVNREGPSRRIRRCSFTRNLQIDKIILLLYKPCIKLLTSSGPLLLTIRLKRNKYSELRCLLWTISSPLEWFNYVKKLNDLAGSRNRPDWWIERWFKSTYRFDDRATLPWIISLLAFYCTLLSSLERNIRWTDGFLTGKGFSYLWSVGRRRRGTILDTSAAMDLPVTSP